MPAASWRTSPARTMSLWLIASASAGSSRSVGMSDRVQRMDYGAALTLLAPGHARIVDQPLDRLPAQDVRLEDLLEVGLLDARVPDVLRVHHDHGAVAALREAARLVDADLGLPARGDDARPQRLDVLLDVALRGAGIARRAHEHVPRVLAHDPYHEESDPSMP